MNCGQQPEDGPDQWKRAFGPEWVTTDWNSDLMGGHMNPGGRQPRRAAEGRARRPPLLAMDPHIALQPGSN